MQPQNRVLKESLTQISPQPDINKPNTLLYYTNETPSQAFLDNDGVEQTYCFFSSYNAVLRYFSSNTNIAIFAQQFFNKKDNNASTSNANLFVSRVDQSALSASQGKWVVSIPLANLTNMQAHDNLTITTRFGATSANDIEINIDGTKIKSFAKLAEIMTKQLQGKAEVVITTDNTNATITITNFDYGVDSIISLVQSASLVGKTDASLTNYFHISAGVQTNGINGVLDVNVFKEQILIDIKIVSYYIPMVIMGFSMTEDKAISLAQFFNSESVTLIKEVNFFFPYNLNQQNAITLENELLINPRFILFGALFKASFSKVMKLSGVLLAEYFSSNIWSLEYVQPFIKLQGLNLGTGNYNIIKDCLESQQVHLKNENIILNAIDKGVISVNYKGAQDFEFYEQTRTINGVKHLPSMDFLGAQYRGFIKKSVSEYIGKNGLAKQPLDLTGICWEVIQLFIATKDKNAIVPFSNIDADTSAKSLIKQCFASSNKIGQDTAIRLIKTLGYTFQTKDTSTIEATNEVANFVAIINTPIGPLTYNVEGIQYIQ